MSKETGRGIISVVVGLAGREILARLILENDLLIPSFSSVLRAPWTLTMDGKLSHYLSATLLESAEGFSTRLRDRRHHRLLHENAQVVRRTHGPLDRHPQGVR